MLYQKGEVKDEMPILRNEEDASDAVLRMESGSHTAQILLRMLAGVVHERNVQ